MKQLEIACEHITKHLMVVVPDLDFEEALERTRANSRHSRPSERGELIRKSSDGKTAIELGIVIHVLVKLIKQLQ